MKREDIEQIPAGPELDRLIDRHVLGILHRSAPLQPCYSTDIARAWFIVACMESRGFHATIRTPFVPGGNNSAGFTPHGTTGWNGRPDFASTAESAPLAICRAALIAVVESKKSEIEL